MNKFPELPHQPRLFLGVPVQATPDLLTLQQHVRTYFSGARLTRENQFHFTVQFLGKTSEELIPQIAERIAPIAASLSPHSARLYGLGTFPNARHPKVVWVGLSRAESTSDKIPAMPDVVSQLARVCATALQSLGFAQEDRAYVPHLTLAYIKSRSGRGWTEFVEQHRNTDCGTIKLDRVILYQSELQPSGSVYTPLRTWRLGGRPYSLIGISGQNPS